MRSLFNRLALVGIVGVALAGCGSTSGSSLPSGGALGSGGGGSVPAIQQNPPGGTVPGLLVDGGTKPYTGYNTVAADALLTTAAEPTDTAGKTAPADVAGSHSIVYSGNELTQQIFAFSGNPINLTIPAASMTPGDILPVDYGAIVFFATPPATAASLSIELTGGAGATAFDVRIACTSKAAATGFFEMNRYLCPLPAYGTVSSTNIVNPVVSASATGTFTPQAAKLYIVVNDAAPLAATSTANTLALDYLYAEQAPE